MSIDKREIEAYVAMKSNFFLIMLKNKRKIGRESLYKPVEQAPFNIHKT